MNVAAIPRFTCNLANPAATFAAMEAHIAPRCSPAAYADRLEAALAGLGTDRRPVQDRLLAQTRAFQESGVADPDAFHRLVNRVFLDETVALFEHAETFGVQWHGYPGARLFAPLNADTFGTGPTVDLRTDPATAAGAWSVTDWCVEALGDGERLAQAFEDDAWGILQLELQSDQGNSERLRQPGGPAAMQLIRCTKRPTGLDFQSRIGALDCLLRHLHQPGKLNPRHVYGEFDARDGVLAYILGERLIGSGIGCFTAHGSRWPALVFTMHDMGHWQVHEGKVDLILRQMELFAVCCTMPTWFRYYTDMLFFTESGYMSAFHCLPVSTIAGVPVSQGQYHTTDELRATFQLLLQILDNPARFNPAWVLEEGVRGRCHANVRQTLAALDAPQ